MITIRASSLPDLFDCPARWEAKYINQMRLPTSGAAQDFAQRELSRYYIARDDVAGEYLVFSRAAA